MDILWLGFRIKTKIMIQEDFEREYLKESVYLQADLIRTQEDIMQEIIEEENRLPARITVIYQTKQPHPNELKDNALPF
jgi:type VI protein secretion system component VasF